MKVLQETDVREIAEILKRDGTVSVATDTVYGVCARMDSIAAQENLREVKHRPKTKAFPLMCSDADMIASVAYIPANAGKLIKALMPGPVTLVLRKKENVPDFVNGGMETLALRMASSEFLKKLIREVGCPLYMTSANESGRPVCTSVSEIMEACPGLDAAVEGQPSFEEASTIIDCSTDEIRILRQGPVDESQIRQILEGE